MYLSFVPWLKKILALTLLAVWSLAANHCKLEHQPGFQSLQCSPVPCAAPHPGDDCQMDVCASVESGFYKSESAQISMPLLVEIILAAICPENFQPVTQDNSVSNAAPPELLQGWQFVFRAASPPRAPSLAS